MSCVGRKDVTALGPPPARSLSPAVVSIEGSRSHGLESCMVGASKSDVEARLASCIGRTSPLALSKDDGRDMSNVTAGTAAMERLVCERIVVLPLSLSILRSASL